MLVLSRKVGERIVIGTDITLVIHRISRSRVSIGIEAPRQIQISRDEPELGAETSTGMRRRAAARRNARVLAGQGHASGVRED